MGNGSEASSQKIHTVRIKIIKGQVVKVANQHLIGLHVHFQTKAIECHDMCKTIWVQLSQRQSYHRKPWKVKRKNKGVKKNNNT